VPSSLTPMDDTPPASIEFLDDLLNDDDEFVRELLDDPERVRWLLALGHEPPTRRALRRLLACARNKGDVLRWLFERLTTPTGPTPAGRPDDQAPPPLLVLADTLARHAPPLRALTPSTREERVA
jgi:hypothetical protein